MAHYTAVCLKCKKQKEYQQPIAHRDVTPICCGQQMERRIINPPMGFVDVKAAG